MKCSRVVLALAAVALASGDLADDFNIPEGWRMEVNSICLCFWMLGYRLPLQPTLFSHAGAAGA